LHITNFLSLLFVLIVIFVFDLRRRYLAALQ
jgi:hypothetical protein